MLKQFYSYEDFTYMDDFFEDDPSIAEETAYNKYSCIPAEYKQEFINYFAQLQEMGNLL